MDMNEHRSSDDGEARRRVWDLPLRVAHWSLAIAVAGAFATHYAGTDVVPVAPRVRLRGRGAGRVPDRVGIRRHPSRALRLVRARSAGDRRLPGRARVGRVRGTQSARRAVGAGAARVARGAGRDRALRERRDREHRAVLRLDLAGDQQPADRGARVELEPADRAGRAAPGRDRLVRLVRRRPLVRAMLDGRRPAAEVAEGEAIGGSRTLLALAIVAVLAAALALVVRRAPPAELAIW